MVSHDERLLGDAHNQKFHLNNVYTNYSAVLYFYCLYVAEVIPDQIKGSDVLRNIVFLQQGHSRHFSRFAFHLTIIPVTFQSLG